MTTTALPPARLAARAAIVTLLGVVLAVCLGVVVFGTVELAMQIASGTTFIGLHVRPDGLPFGFEGPVGVETLGRETILESAVTGLSAGATAIGTAAGAARILTWLVLGLATFTLLRGIRVRRAFDRGVVRHVAMAGVALLVLGTVAQLLGWWATNAALDEFGVENNAWVYLRELEFHPLTLAVGLTLLLAALAFRAGERLQRDAEGLI